MRRLIHRLASRLFLWSCRRSLNVEGAIEHEPARMRVLWNDPIHKSSRDTTPLFVVEFTNSVGGVARMVLSPAQFNLFVVYGIRALDDSQRKFQYPEYPDFDVHWVNLEYPSRSPH